MSLVVDSYDKPKKHDSTEYWYEAFSGVTRYDSAQAVNDANITYYGREGNGPFSITANYTKNVPSSQFCYMFYYDTDFDKEVTFCISNVDSYNRNAFVFSKRSGVRYLEKTISYRNPELFDNTITMAVKAGDSIEIFVGYGGFKALTNYEPTSNIVMISNNDNPNYIRPQETYIYDFKSMQFGYSVTGWPNGSPNPGDFKIFKVKEI